MPQAGQLLGFADRCNRQLDFHLCVVKNASMKAELLKQHHHATTPSGRVHLNGERLVSFDNERGKGDHKHLDEKESAYRFVSIDQLLDDFIAEVERRVE